MMDTIKREKFSCESLDKFVGIDDIDTSWLLDAEESVNLGWPLDPPVMVAEHQDPDLTCLSSMTIAEEESTVSPPPAETSAEPNIILSTTNALVSPADDASVIEGLPPAGAFTATSKPERKPKEKTTKTKSAKQNRRTSRKDDDLQQMKEIAFRLAQQKSELEKQLRLTQYKKRVRKRSRQSEGAGDGDSDSGDDEQLMKEMLEKEELLRKRRHTLQTIWEAWNIGGLDDMEEISEEVYHPEATLINPDLSRELKGRSEIMAYWSSLISAFPDGIMLDYDIQEEDPAGEKFKINWTFSGTQVEPLYGIPARRKQISIPGRSYITFKGEQIYQLVIVWNYREMLMELLGLRTEAANTSQ